MVVGAFVVYLLAANVILRTHLLRGWVSDAKGDRTLEYRSAWSLYPGHVAIRDLSLRYQNDTAQMLILIERGKLQIDLFALTKHTFRVSKLNAEGLSYLLRQRVESVEGQEERVRAFAPIAGFADPPIAQAEVPEPPVPDDQYDSWIIDMPDISASLREVWTMEFRYRGEGTLEGGFYVKPQREVWVRPSVMVTHGGLYSLGERDLVRGGEGRLEAQMGPFDVRQAKGLAVLRHLSAGIHQHGELVFPSLTATYLPKDSGVELTQGTGPVAVDIVLERGVFQPKTRVTFHTEDVFVKAPSIAVHSDLDLLAHVDVVAEKPVVVLETVIARAKGTPLDVHEARAMIALDNADLVAPIRIVRASGSVKSAHASDLRAWQRFAPDSTSFDSGGATVAARGEYHDGALEGRVDLVLDKARMTIGPFTFETTGKAWTNLVSEDLAKAVAFPGSGVDLRDVALKLKSGHAEGLWLRSRFQNARLSTASPVGFDTDIAVDSGPGDRTLELFTRLVSLPDVAADVASGTQLAASLQMRVRSGLISLAVTKAKNGPLESRGRVAKRSGEQVSGAFLVNVGPFHAGLDLHGGGVSVAPLAGGGWLEDKLEKR